MLGLLNCVYTAWYEWYEITITDMKYNLVKICMIWERKNEKRYDMNDERYVKRYEKWYDMYLMLAGLN